jgi:HK97 gp10 family phage protein
VATTLVIHQRDVDELLHSRTGEVGRTMMRLGMMTRDIAMRLAPYDTGALADSINWSWGASVGLARNSVIVSASVSYAWYVENGTRNQEAQPFLEPALMQAIATI